MTGPRHNSTPIFRACDELNARGITPTATRIEAMRGKKGSPIKGSRERIQQDVNAWKIAAAGELQALRTENSALKADLAATQRKLAAAEKSVSKHEYDRDQFFNEGESLRFRLIQIGTNLRLLQDVISDIKKRTACRVDSLVPTDTSEILAQLEPHIKQIWELQRSYSVDDAGLNELNESNDQEIDDLLAEI